MVIRTCGSDCEFYSTNDVNIVTGSCFLYNCVDPSVCVDEASFNEGSRCSFKLQQDSEHPKDEFGLCRILNRASGLFTQKLTTENLSVGVYQAFINAENGLCPEF